MPKKGPRKASSRRWLDEHHSDTYVKQARDAGYRSRAVFKLEEIDKKDRLFKPGMTVVDLGAAPGGWSQYAAQRLKGRGHVIALDILPIEPIPDVDVIEGDFREEAPLAELQTLLGGKSVDLVLSDMAPNLSGVGPADQAAAMYLVELAQDFAVNHLAPQGCFLTKVFQGEGFDNYFRELKQQFKVVSTRKPQASRGRSKELYLLCQGLRLV
ncbi:MAG: 23S rRNA (uridine(2552)-2'-O)-methyltransferase RlmE [Oleiphilaceae bacterium]|nr:23S rRNA (uridine(2552)-2'-O)-methyltransferase RlmE [Oleiphilaceae bacterium]